MCCFDRWLLLPAGTVPGTVAWSAGIVEHFADIVGDMVDIVGHPAGIVGDMVDIVDHPAGIVEGIAGIVLLLDYVYPPYSPNHLLAGCPVFHRRLGRNPNPFLSLLTTENPLFYMGLHPIPSHHQILVRDGVRGFLVAVTCIFPNSTVLLLPGLLLCRSQF